MYIWRGGLAVSLGVYYPVPYVFAPWGSCFSPGLGSYIIWERYRVRQMARRSRPLVGHRGDHRRVLSPSVRDIPREARPKTRIAPDPRAIGLARRSSRAVPKGGDLAHHPQRQPGSRDVAKPAPHMLPAAGAPVANRDRARALRATSPTLSPVGQPDRRTAAENLAARGTQVPPPRIERRTAASNLAERNAEQHRSDSPRPGLAQRTPRPVPGWTQAIHATRV